MQDPHRQECSGDKDMSSGQRGEDHNFPHRPIGQCRDCSQDRRLDPEGLCLTCWYYRRRPDERPGYWTWTKMNGTWLATTRIGDDHETPRTGGIITVNRKDGTTSEATITEIDIVYDRKGTLQALAKTRR